MRSRFGLTGRGWALTGCGAVLTAAAAFIGEPDLVWLGVFLALLAPLGLLVLLAAHPKLTAERQLEPSVVPVGSRARAKLRISNSATLSYSELSFTDRLPARLGRSAGFQFARGFGRWSQAAGYHINARQRGHFQIGALHVEARDPLGVAWRLRQLPGELTSLRITPLIWELPLPRGGRLGGGNGEATPQRIGAAGPDDVLIREHRQGDGMRRVHWKMSAKRGELMVRLEEQPWDPNLVVLIDTRASSHIGQGAQSTAEWAISGGASLATSLLQERLRVSVLGSDGVIFRPLHGESEGAANRLLIAMTDLNLSPRDTLEHALADPEDLGNPQALTAWLGALTSTDAAALAAATARVAQVAALVPDADAFQLPSETSFAHEEACRLLRSNGWNLVTYGPAESIPDAWQRLLTHGEAR